MDKSRELQLFKYIYGESASWDVISVESPDFVCTRNSAPVLGVEITDLYYTESDARLKKIEGYPLDLLRGGDFRHKDDKKHIRVERIKYFKRGKGRGREITAIIYEPPSLPDRASLLMKTIEKKEQKVDTYLKACPMVDLIIDDASHMFCFDEYEHFYLPLSRVVNRHLITQSRFREIFLITAKKEESIVRIPLKLNLVVEDINIFERLIRDSVARNKYDDPKKAFTLLFCCLQKSGHQNITVTTNDGSVGLMVGSSLYLYSKHGKEIYEGTTIPEHQSKGELISTIIKQAYAAEEQETDKLVAERAKYKCCMSLFSEVENI